MLDPWEMLKPEERRAVQAVLSNHQSGGTTYSQKISREWLLEDGNIQHFMLYYFPRDFWEWEPVNDHFFGFLEDGIKGMAWLPGQHGKTTMLLRWFIYVMCREPQISIGYTEKNEPTAMKRGLAIMQQLSVNKRLIDHFGRFKPTDSLYPWSMGNFTIRQRPELGDSPTFSAFGAGGGSILGWRFNILCNDDPVTAENSASEAERGNLLRWFNAAAKTCPTPLPLTMMRYLLKHFLIGTVFRMDDLYHQVLKGGEYDLLHLKAVLDETTGATLSPRYVYENPQALAEKARIDPIYAELKEAVDHQLKINLYTFKYGTEGGTIAYFQRYQNVAVDPDAQEWKDIYFTGGELPSGESYPGCYDTERTYGMFDPNWIIVTALDPQSGSKTRQSARVGLITLGAHMEQPDLWYVINMDWGKFKQQSADPNARTQMSILVADLVRYNSRGVIESNAAQAGLVDAAYLEAQRRKVLIKCGPHHTGKNKVDPYVGVESMLPMFERGRVRLPYMTVSDQRKSQELANEFTMMGVYPYTDLVMAFWMAGYRLKKRLAARKQAREQREAPEYVNRLPGDWHIPRHWTKAQTKAFLNQSNEDDFEEAV
jgi:hypothetical protein